MELKPSTRLSSRFRLHDFTQYDESLELATAIALPSAKEMKEIGRGSCAIGHEK